LERKEKERRWARMREERGGLKGRGLGKTKGKIGENAIKDDHSTEDGDTFPDRKLVSFKLFDDLLSSCDGTNLGSITRGHELVVLACDLEASELDLNQGRKGIVDE